MTHLREPDAAAQQRGSTTVSQPALFVQALDDAALFALLDEIAEGLAHEARLDALLGPANRAALLTMLTKIAQEF